MKIVSTFFALSLLASSAFAGVAPVTRAVTAQNQFTAAIEVQSYGTVVISGTFDATVTLQRSHDGGTTWVDTGDTWTVAGVYTFTDHSRQLYRVGVKTGGFTSGTANLWLGSK